ncbi:MAG: hypothetical protein KYQ20_02380 [Candidatus Nealsonbacteria bacterium]|nr:hypothetical protein [Candidatus Nealsonbacteria bacterium]
MSPLYIDSVLTPAQKVVFRKLTVLNYVGTLAGGTALAFQLKHRKSFDFDIFTSKNIPPDLAWENKKIFGKKIRVIKESENELTFVTPKKVKITFFYYPFKPLYKIIRTDSIFVFDWKDIAADKAYTLGRRPIYRDYLDIFFIIRKGHKLENIILDAKKKFGGLFSTKLFLGQLTYFKDLQDFKIEFLGESFQPEEIKSFFEKAAKQYTKNIFKKK